MPDSFYNIPQSNPHITLLFDGLQTPPMNPIVVLLSVVENMQPVCRHFLTAFPPTRIFDYGLIRTIIRNRQSSECGLLTYNDVCTVLRGLAEFMVGEIQFYQWQFRILVNGYESGSGQIDVVHQMLPAVSATGVTSS